MPARKSGWTASLFSMTAVAAIGFVAGCSAIQSSTSSDASNAVDATAATDSSTARGDAIAGSSSNLQSNQTSSGSLLHRSTPGAPAMAPGGHAGSTSASATGTADGTSAATRGDAASARISPRAPAPEARVAAAESGPGNSFVFDPRKLRWYAYGDDGKLVRSGRASGGKSYCPDLKRSCRTPAGRYTVYRKGGAGCRSTKFPIPRGGAPMPYCMFFRGGYAIHGGQVPGHNASHGCIRVPRSDAQWLHRNFVAPGTTVIVRKY